jgi:uncharacterized membrane protein YfcA
MFEFIIIVIAALGGSLLTFYSGFGLGTILLPVFSLFFPIELAVALTGIVHLLNNAFKLGVIGKSINWKVVIQFGIPAFIAAFLGAYLLVYLANGVSIYEYSLANKTCEITSVKLTVAVLMFLFAALELLPAYKKLSFEKNKLALGGVLSGFFGGLSGHQGALRSAFLIKCGLDKVAFIATGSMIAMLVDISRISTYFTKLSFADLQSQFALLIAAVCAAFAGVLIGKRMLAKITIHMVNQLVTILIMLLSILLGAGII